MAGTTERLDSSTTESDDGRSPATGEGDGASRVDNADGSSTTTYRNGRVLNTSRDGTTTLNDGNGVALDPETGEPIAAAPPVQTAPCVTTEEIETGVHVILTLTEAAAIVIEAEVALTFLEPLNALLAPIAMGIALWRALEASVRAYGTMGHCYALLYGTLDLGRPTYPEGAYSLDSEATIRDKRASFAQGADEGAAQLATGADGVALRNRILIRTAALRSDPRATLNELWRIMCAGTGDEFYAQKLELGWPEPAMTEA